MRRRGRPVDQNFEMDERLFYRLEDAYPVGSHPVGLSVRKPDFSVNREKHGGQPEYVLIPDWMHCGVAEFKCSDLPSELRSEGNVPYSWTVLHVPEDLNYHHSEVHTMKSGQNVHKQSQVSTLLYREFRQRLSESMLVIRCAETKE